MRKNFVIDRGNALLVGAEIYDLHNHYDLISIAIDPLECSLRLIFRPNEPGLSPDVVLKFMAIDYLEIGPPENGVLRGDLVELGYKSSGDRDLDWLLPEEQCSPFDHVLLRFARDSYLRVHAEVAEVAIAVSGKVVPVKAS